jgi:hypothetical protein
LMRRKRVSRFSLLTILLEREGGKDMFVCKLFRMVAHPERDRSNAVVCI